MTKKPTHGGARTGTGPKPKYGETKVKTSVAISPLLMEFLAEQPESKSELIEETLRRSSRFKFWHNQRR